MCRDFRSEFLKYSEDCRGFLLQIFADSYLQNTLYAGVQGKNNEYHNVDKVQNSFIDALIFDLIDNVVFVVFALYSSMPYFRPILFQK
jgi:hypothetical protein